MRNHEFNFSLTSYRLHYSRQIFLVSFLLHSRRSAHDLHHHFSHRFRHLNLKRAEFLFSICMTYRLVENEVRMHIRMNIRMLIHILQRLVIFASIEAT